MTPSQLVLPFEKKLQVSKDAYAFYFDRSSHPFDFFPGQYIRMILPHDNMDERGDRRYFSIITSPLNKNELGITTRIIQSSFKKALFNLTPSTPVAFWGPLGTFTLNENEIQPHIFLAGGIGITPIHSMITYAAEKNLQTPLYLFVSFSTIDEMIFYDDMMQAAQKNSSIKVIYTITHPEESNSSQKWSGEIGRISVGMIKKYIGKSSNALFYIVGPEKMVEAMEQIAKGIGATDEQIRKENFVGY